MESIIVCSVCSKAFSSWERNVAVDEDVLKLLQFLFKKINCSVIRNTRICENCLENVQAARNFKMLCVEKQTLNLALKMEQIDPEISCICQICKEFTKKSSSVATTKGLKLMDYLMEEMQMGIEVTENDCVCISCQESIVSFHSVVKLLSNFVENNEHKCNIKIETELLSDPNKIEIKEEPLMEYETESIQSNEVNLTYENFIMKNEEVDIKPEDEESNSTKQMQKVIQEHDKINVASKHFTVDHNNDKTIQIYKTSNIPKFTCDVCGYKTKRKGDHTRHMLQHMSVDEIEMFACDICDYKTKSKQYIKRHMLKHKNADEIEMFTCNVCDYKAKRKDYLKRHMLKHQNVDEIEMFTCNVCDYKTKRKGHLKIHMLKHMNVDEIEMFSCDVCDYKAKHKSSLKMHMLQHKNVDEIKMFACNVCDYRTKRKDDLKKHMLKHMNADEIEIFACDSCDYKTKRKLNLKRHMLTHKNVDEIEMFVCDVCDHKTKHKSSLKIHMVQHKSVNEIEIFACDVCDYKAKYKSYLKRHMLQHKS